MKIIKPANNRNLISTGFSLPNAKQFPVLSTFDQMTQRELLRSLEQEGLFEDQTAKSHVVVIYHSWDEYCSQRIAKAVLAEPVRLEFALLVYTRRTRNLIIHQNSAFPDGICTSLKFLPKTWNLESAKLSFTRGMVESLLDLVNALHLTFSDPYRRARCLSYSESL